MFDAMGDWAGLAPGVLAAIALLAGGVACVIAALVLAWRRRAPRGTRVDLLVEETTPAPVVASEPTVDAAAIAQRVEELDRRVRELQATVSAEATRRAMAHADGAGGVEAHRLRRQAALG